MLTKKTLALAPISMALALVLAPVAAFAQTPPDGAPPAAAEPAAPAPAPAPAAAATGGAANLLGVDVAIGVPLGNFGDAAGIGFGPLVRFEHNLIPKLNLTGRVGFIYHLGKDVGTATITYTEIPVLVGAKYDVTDAIYGAAEIGVIRTGASVKIGGTTGSSSDTNLGLTLGGGYKLNAIDIRAGLHILDLGHAGDSMELVVGAGYNFWQG